MDTPASCPDCGAELFVRHMEGGAMSGTTAQHYVSSIYWQAECHAAECQWLSPKRSTPFALLKVLQELEPDPDGYNVR